MLLKLMGRTVDGDLSPTAMSMNKTDLRSLASPAQLYAVGTGVTEPRLGETNVHTTNPSTIPAATQTPAKTASSMTLPFRVN